jgi:hypothetical protein
MDSVAWFIATAHNLLGHDKTAALIGAGAGDKSRCLICAYERHPTEERRQAVITALSPESR